MKRIVTLISLLNLLALDWCNLVCHSSAFCCLLFAFTKTKQSEETNSTLSHSYQNGTTICFRFQLLIVLLECHPCSRLTQCDRVIEVMSDPDDNFPLDIGQWSYKLFVFKCMQVSECLFVTKTHRERINWLWFNVQKSDGQINGKPWPL